MNYSWLKYIGLAMVWVVVIIAVGVAGIGYSIFSTNSALIPYASLNTSFFVHIAVFYVIIGLLAFGIFAPKVFQWILPLIGIFIALIITAGIPSFANGLLSIGFGLEILGVWLGK